MVFGNFIILGVLLLIAINILVLVVEMITNFILLFRRGNNEKTDLKSEIKINEDSVESLKSGQNDMMSLRTNDKSPINIQVGKFKKKVKG